MHLDEGGRRRLYVCHGTGNFDVLVSGIVNRESDGFAAEITGQLTVRVATLGQRYSWRCLLFSAARNATVVLREDETSATVWRIHRDDFNYALRDDENASHLEQLKKQFACDPKSRRHGGGLQKIALASQKSPDQEMKLVFTDGKRGPRRIATPGQLVISDDSVNAPDFDTIRSLQESDAAQTR